MQFLYIWLLHIFLYVKQVIYKSNPKNSFFHIKANEVNKGIFFKDIYRYIYIHTSLFIWEPWFMMFGSEEQK